MRNWMGLWVLVAACGGGDSQKHDDAAPDAAGGGADAAADAMGDDGSDGAPSTDSGVPLVWTTLIDRQWQVTSVTELWRCVSMEVTEDMYIGAIRPTSPDIIMLGALTISETPFESDGDYDCFSTDNGSQMIYAFGAGTEELVFPPGVGVKLTAGTYINLNLHLANFSSNAASGATGVEVALVPAAEIEHEVDMMFLGTEYINLLPSPEPQPVMEGTFCVIPTTWNVVALWPHMHTLATRQEVWVERAADDAIEDQLDVAYSHTEQLNHRVDLTLNPNDAFSVNCYYNNTTMYPIPSGYSAAAEACLTGFYKYPTGGPTKFCIDN